METLYQFYLVHMYIQAVDTLTAIIKKNIIKLNKNISIKSNNIRLTEVVLNARLQENFRVVYATCVHAYICKGTHTNRTNCTISHVFIWDCTVGAQQDEGVLPHMDHLYWQHNLHTDIRKTLKHSFKRNLVCIKSIKKVNNLICVHSAELQKE